MPDSSSTESSTSPVVVNVAGAQRGRLWWILLAACAVVCLVLGGVITAKVAPMLQGDDGAEMTNTQVVRSIEFTEDITLLSLSVEAVATQDTGSHIGSWRVPGTGESVFMRYGFDAKLGIDGSQVVIEQTGDLAYTVTVPAFEFLAYDDFAFETLTEKNGVLSVITPDIDKEQMVNELINDEVKAQHVANNTDLLKRQCEAFYNNIVHAIDPNIVLTFVYTDAPAPAASAAS